MAPTFLAGKDIDVLMDEKDLSKFLNSFTVSASLDPLEVTAFDDGGDRAYIKGLGDATVSLDGLYSVTTDSTDSPDEWNVFLDDALGGSTRVVVTITPQPQTTGGRAFMLTGDITSYDISSPVDGTVDTSIDIQASGGSRGYTGGVMLLPLVVHNTATITGGAAVDSGADSTLGGVSHLHITAADTTGALDVQMQHSTSGSTWVTLINHGQFSSPTFERSTVAGTVKQFLRTLLDDTSTGPGTYTLALAFGRHGVRT